MCEDDPFLAELGIIKNNVNENQTNYDSDSSTVDSDMSNKSNKKSGNMNNSDNTGNNYEGCLRICRINPPNYWPKSAYIFNFWYSNYI